MALPGLTFHTGELGQYYPDLAESLTKGFMLARLPKEQKLKEQHAQELINQLLLGNQAATLENQYLPTKLRQQEEERGLKNIHQGLINQYYGPEKEANIGLTRTQIEANNIANMIQRKTGLPRAEADLLAQHLANKKAELENEQLPEKHIDEAKTRALSNEILAQQVRLNELYGEEAKKAEIEEKKQKSNPRFGEQQKAIAKEDAKFYGKNSEALSASYIYQNDIDAMQNVLDNPLARQVVGPINKVTALKDPQTRILLGEYNTAQGSLVTGQLSAMKGATSDKELAFAQKTKIGPNDTYEQALGKLNLLKQLNAIVMARREYIAEAMSDGASSSEALKNAMIKYPFPSGGKSSNKEVITDEDIKYTAQVMNMTEQQVRDQLKKEGRL